MGRKKKALPELSGIEITAIAAEGKSIAKIQTNPESEDRMVVFIPFGAPGDIADIKIDRKKHSYAEAHITRLVSPSLLRVTPQCKHFGTCGGCKWQHLPYSYQLECKHSQVFDALTRIAKIELPEISPILGSENVWRYRNKTEYTFSNKKWRTWEEMKSDADTGDSSDALGFHIPGAFDKVLHIESCHLQCELADNIRNWIYSFASDNGYSFYDIKNNVGLLRTLMIRTASTGEVLVCLSFGEADNEKIKTLLTALSEKFGDITSLVYVINTKLNDTISDLEIKVFKGRDYIEEEMEGLRFRINAKSFYQTNSVQAYNLYKVARQFAGLDNIPADNRTSGPLVYDLYTGIGTIANFVAKRCSKVIGIEYVPEAIEDAKLNSRVNGIENTLFFAGDMKDILTDEFVERHGHPDIIITDPPRAGMHEDVIKVILNCRPERIVYVSCNPATQARDLALLDGAYKVEAIQPVDMFPHTHHIENVVALSLRK